MDFSMFCQLEANTFVLLVKPSGERKTYLVTSGAARLELFGVVSLTVELILVNAIGQIDEQLRTSGTLETGRMPGHVFTKFRCHDAVRAGRNVAFTTVTLLQNKNRINKII